MPAPSNNSFLTATDLGTTLPTTVTQNVNADGDGPWNVYYKYTAQAGDTELSAYASGNLTTYRPRTNIYYGAAGAPTSFLNGVQNSPVQTPLTAGTVYYLEIVPLLTDSTGDLTLRVDVIAANSGPSGSLLIPDDTELFPLAVLDATTGAPIAYVPGFATGESGVSLPTGEIVAQNYPDTAFKVYDATLTQVASVSYTGGLGDPPANRGASTFYVGSRTGVGTATIKHLSSAGAVLATYNLTGTTALVGISPNVAETKIYTTGKAGSTDSAISVWDIAGNTWDADLIASLGGGYNAPFGLLTLGDGTIVVLYQKNSATPNLTLKTYSSAGALLQSRDFGSSIRTDVASRLTYDLADPTYFWLWQHHDDGTGTFYKLKASDLTTSHSMTRTDFETGIYQTAGSTGTLTPTAYFGASWSCPFFLLMGSTPTPTVQIPPFDCGNSLTTQTITLTGTGFGSSPTVTVTDPSGTVIPFTITSHTTTQIVGTMTVATCGVWSFSVCNGGLCVTATVDTGTNYPVRRLRRFLLPSDMQRRVFLSRLEFLAQTGVGLTTGQGSDPVVMVRVSWDGGFTWGNERHLTLGKIGDYFARVYTTRLGAGRQPVCEIVTSDPVFVAFLDCVADLEPGTA